MRLIVCGGRDYDDYARVNSALDAIHRKTPITVLIVGGAPGVDFHAECWADHAGVPKHVEHADWTTHGRAAGPIRNAKMLTLVPDGVLAFPGGRGTADMVRQADLAGVTVWAPYG